MKKSIRIVLLLSVVATTILSTTSASAEPLSGSPSPIRSEIVTSAIAAVLSLLGL